MVDSLAMATIASFVCSDAIFGVPISTETRHRFSFHELIEPRCMRQFLNMIVPAEMLPADNMENQSAWKQDD
jgi:hypothetical protein